MTKANEGEPSRPHSQGPQSFGHYSQKKTFLLRLKSGLQLRIRAQGVARSGNLCLFLHDQCFVEIPESAIDSFSTSNAPDKAPKRKPSERAHHDGARYSVQLPGNHLCLVICSELECDRGVFHFLSNKRPFLTILNAAQYKLRISRVSLD